MDEEWKPDRDVICKCGGWMWTARQYYDDDDEFIIELVCMKCESVETFTMVIHCHECEGTDLFQEGYNCALEDEEGVDRDAREEKYSR